MNTIPLKYSVFPKDENPIFGEFATHISIDDEAAGGFIVIEQFPDEGPQKIKLDLPELEELLRLANKLMAAYDHVTGEKPKPKENIDQYIIEVKYSEYGEPSYKFKSLFTGTTGTWVDNKEEAIKQAENHIRLIKMPIDEL